MKYNTLTTGKDYTLAELFANNNKIIIPDLQRDYCWGGTSVETEGNLVRTFMQNLINNGFNKEKTNLSLGLIYGYEAPVGHIQLCDGQQRITTLFLLLGMLNKKSNNVFQEQLISDFELNHDDKEPYLQYSIRESSLYFLSDLVSHFFINSSELSVDEIFKQPWFFNDYNFDPSIQSMLKAMKIIEQEISEIDTKEFGKYLIERLSFIYYDMVSRKNGEETFVIINTTGEPLSATENLKALFISEQELSEQAKCSDLWEKWETWFWQHRQGAGEKKNDTAENGFREFFRWITMLNTKDEIAFKKNQETGDFKFDVKMDVNIINKYFEIIENLFNIDIGLFKKDNFDWLAPDKSDDKNRNSQVTCFRLLPVIEYVNRFGNDNVRGIERVKIFFENLSRIDNVTKGISDLLPQAIKIMKELPDNDIASILRMKNVSSQILTIEEKLKFELYLKADDRGKFEKLFWEAESHKIWSGQIMPLLKWSEVNGNFDINRFIYYNNIFISIFKGECENRDLDITRRALLTRGLNRYPRCFRGYTNFSFCWEYSDWKTLIDENSENFKLFFDELVDDTNLISKQNKMIDAFDSSKDWAEFVKIAQLLEFCEEKNIQFHNNEKGWALIKQKRVTRYANLKSYLLFLDLQRDCFLDETIWEVGFYDQENTCAFFNKKDYINQVAIDVFHVSNDRYMLQLFCRNKKAEEVKEYLSKSADFLTLKFEGERYNSEYLDRNEVLDLTKKAVNLLSK